MVLSMLVFASSAPCRTHKQPGAHGQVLCRDRQKQSVTVGWAAG